MTSCTWILQTMLCLPSWRQILFCCGSISRGTTWSARFNTHATKLVRRMFCFNTSEQGKQTLSFELIERLFVSLSKSLSENFISCIVYWIYICIIIQSTNNGLIWLQMFSEPHPFCVSFNIRLCGLIQLASDVWLSHPKKACNAGRALHVLVPN